MCVTRAPEIFGQNEADGVVRVLQPNPSPALHRAARDAAAGCPVQAISLDETPVAL
jgi:ferredoxin